MDMAFVFIGMTLWAFLTSMQIYAGECPTFQLETSTTILLAIGSISLLVSQYFQSK